MPAEPVKSAKRAIEVLECFAVARRRMTGTEIAESLGYPKSSTNALARSLVALGYLDLDEITKTYFPTMRVTLLGDWLPATRSDLAGLDEILLRVRDKTRETVTLSAQADLDMVFMRVLPSTHPIALNLEAGSRAPLFGSAVGMALLASFDDDHVDRLIRRAQGRHSVTESRLAQIPEGIRVARRDGYALASGLVLPETAAMGAALPISPPAAPIVLGVGGPVDRILAQETAIAAVLLGIVVEMARRARPQALRLARGSR